MKKGLCSLCKACKWLLVIGGLNWLLVGLFDWNLVTAITSGPNVVERIIYVIVGVAALGVLGELLGMCKNCKPGKCDDRPEPAAPSVE